MLFAWLFVAICLGRGVLMKVDEYFSENQQMRREIDSSNRRIRELEKKVRLQSIQINDLRMKVDILSQSTVYVERLCPRS